MVMRGRALLVLSVAQGLGWSGAVPTLAPEPAPPSTLGTEESRLGPFGELAAGPWASERRAAQVVDANGCGGIMGGLSAELGDACCADPKARCGESSSGAPHSCSRDCATVWMPFQKQCSLWILESYPAW